jgi:phenylpyruvate tautomerase PptA (4-oxalocrotonate tautomerase family)
MAQVKIYGLRSTLDLHKQGLSQAIHRSVVANIGETCGISPQDIEITIFETPRENWGIRGLPGDELALGYEVQV